MNRCSVYFIDSGFPEDLPGFSPEVASASFPFWGHHCSLDFAAAAFRELDDQDYTVVAENRFRTLSAFITGRGGKEKLIFLDRGIAGLIELIAADPADTILISPLNLICDPDRTALKRIVAVER